MKQSPHERAVALALYITEHQSTVRAAAAAFGISKSTVHKDVTKSLRRLDPDLFDGLVEWGDKEATDIELLLEEMNINPEQYEE